MKIKGYFFSLLLVAGANSAFANPPIQNIPVQNLDKIMFTERSKSITLYPTDETEEYFASEPENMFSLAAFLNKSCDFEQFVISPPSESIDFDIGSSSRTYHYVSLKIGTRAIRETLHPLQSPSLFFFNAPLTHQSFRNSLRFAESISISLEFNSRKDIIEMNFPTQGLSKVLEKEIKDCRAR